MKMLYVLFAVAFLVYQVQANPQPPSEDEAKEPLDPEMKLKEDPGLMPPPDDSERLKVVLCQGFNGYCLPRGFSCHNGLVFAEVFNNCPFSAVLKCCVR
ncbi:Hypothetical predicted protein [Podarcis lilfordi]|uniref:Uncharacterized protein n=1 Tax=Podarcis lilfordi TaxID=74358 RepID=A0AA35P3D9_9SAUR|nr:Hypothetical predicted protein [Podarcis lilfordi]